MKKEIMIISGILVLFCFLWSESSTAALELLIEKSAGREKVELLLELAKGKLSEDLEGAQQANNQALELARDLPYPQGESRALNIAGRIELARGEYWLAIDHFKQALLLVDEESGLLEMAVINSNIALAYNRLGWSDKAIDNLLETEEIYKSLEETPQVTEELAKCYLNRGTIELERGRFEEALAIFLLGMQEAEKIDDGSLEASLKGYMGRVYQSLLNPELSKEYYQQALEVHLQMNNRAEAAIVYGNMGTLYAEMEDFEQALSYYERSLAEYRLLGDNLGVASVLGNMGNLYYYQRDFKRTLEYYQQVLEIFTAMGDGVYMAYLTNNMGMIYLEMGDYQKAEAAMRQALEYARTYKSLELKAEIAASLSELYRMLGKENSAWQYKEMESSLRDSLFAATTASQIAEMQTKYNTERKERENVLLRKDNEIKELELARREMQRNYLLGLALVVIILVLFIYQRYRSKKKAAEILTAKNTLISAQKEELAETLMVLRSTQKKLVESEKMASLGSLVTGVAHEINTPVGIMITAASNLAERQKALMEKYQNNLMKKSDLDNFLLFLEKSGELILSNSLRTGELVQSFKQVSVDEATEARRRFKIKSYIHNVLTSLEPKWKNRKIAISITGDEELEWLSYPGILAQIITNLIMNSLVHAFREDDSGEIGISFTLSGERLLLEYYDTGKGIAEDILPKIFDPFFTTNKQTGSGLGLHIVYNLACQKLAGNISVESKPGRGTRFLLDLPYMAGSSDE